MTASTSGAYGLPVIMRSAMRGADGDFSLVALKVDPERLVIQAAMGPLAEDMTGNLMWIRDSLAAPVFRSGEPLLVPDYPRQGGAAPEIRPRIGSVILVPLVADEQVEGTLAVGRLTGRPAFVAAELEALNAFIKRTGTARELQQLQEERRTARLIEDQTRVRADLHDHVIQELFATGMALQVLAERVAEADARRQLLSQVDALDVTMHRIRSLISEPVPGGATPRPMALPKRLIAIVDSLTPALRCLPTVAFVGPVESRVRGGLAQDLQAVLREALTNVARHAAATAVRISVTVADGTLILSVTDDGVGVGEPARRSGITNMSMRAGRYAGRLELSTPTEGGTELRWTARLPD